MTREAWMQKSAGTLQDIGTVYLGEEIPPEILAQAEQDEKLSSERLCAAVENKEAGLRICFSKKALCVLSAPMRLPSGEVGTGMIRTRLALPMDDPEREIDALKDFVLPPEITARLTRFFQSFLCVLAVREA